jgi:hypothetical protein
MVGPSGSTEKEELIMVMLSTLSPRVTLAAGTGNILWINVVVVAVFVLGGLAAAIALRRP